MYIKVPPNSFFPINKENSFIKNINIWLINNMLPDLKYQNLHGNKNTKLIKTKLKKK